jgi:hypothetical protein
MTSANSICLFTAKYWTTRKSGKFATASEQRSNFTTGVRKGINHWALVSKIMITRTQHSYKILDWRACKLLCAQKRAKKIYALKIPFLNSQKKVLTATTPQSMDRVELKRISQIGFRLLLTNSKMRALLAKIIWASTTSWCSQRVDKNVLNQAQIISVNTTAVAENSTSKI